MNAANCPLLLAMLLLCLAGPIKARAQSAGGSEATGGDSPGRLNVTSSNSRFERKVLDLTNQARREQGLESLQWSDSLARAARYHAAHMAKYRYFDHDSHLPDGRRMSAAERIRHFDPHYSGENIAWNQPNPQEVIRTWMQSPGHRKNILNPESTRLGVGYVRGYWVQVFGR